MNESFQKGWEYWSQSAVGGLAGQSGAAYCNQVESAISNFEHELYDMVQSHGCLDADKLKGFVAETWHAETFNINATLNSSAHRAIVDKSTDLGSVDISTNFGRSFSSKFLRSAQDSANAQAKDYYKAYYEYLRKPRKGDPLTFEQYLQKYGLEDSPEALLKSVYNGQYRLIPKDQLYDAKKYLEKLLAKESQKDGPNRALVYNRYLETLNKLTDRISDGDGNESIPLDKDSAEVIVELCREGEFKAEEFGIDLRNLITRDYIIHKALKAGYTAATMSIVLEIAPKLCNAIFHLIKTGEIDAKQFKELGMNALTAPAKGFIRGYVSCGLTIACKAGKLGAQFANIQPNVVASVVVLAMDTLHNGLLVAKGRMTIREMEAKTEDAAVISIASLIGGSLGTALLPHLAVVGYMVGSFVGGVIGNLVVEGKNRCIMALCATTGITLFGLVKQDYTLSPEMIRNLGINVISLNCVKLNYIQPNFVKINRVPLHYVEPNYIDLLTLRRGVIGVRTIGYK